MNKTSIEWTHRPETGGAAGGFTWNPIRARLKKEHDYESAVGEKPKSGTFCTRISPGCTNCYASVINKRFGNGLEYTVPNLEKVEFYIDEKILAQPLKRKKPATIFVGDMFDLFHEAIPDELIVPVVAVAALSGHTMQFLTKRAERMLRFFTWLSKSITPLEEAARKMGYSFQYAGNFIARPEKPLSLLKWPIPNIWLGVSVESQKYADERIPLLLQTPAAVRFLSVEPMLEAVNIGLDQLESEPHGEPPYFRHAADCGSFCDFACGGVEVIGGVDWVICDGESGHAARPFNLAWAESLQEQCKAAGVAFFMKQVGSAPIYHRQFNHDGTIEMPAFSVAGEPIKLKDSKGGDPSEWPERLRVREFPSEKLVTA